VSEPADIGSLDAVPENEGWLRDLNEVAARQPPDDAEGDDDA
jgi:hypothetical protein